MRQATILLRREVVERSIKGTVESRDIAISRFLGELSELFTERLINTLDANTLGGMFEDWLSSLTHLGYEERLKAVSLDVRLCSIPYTMYHKGFVDERDMEQTTPTSGNVVALHTR